MEATDILMDEHRVIERVIGALEVAARRLQQGEPVRAELFLDAVDFIRSFADGCHHAKEEGVLFKEMEAAGMPVQAGPIGVMLQEHELGRKYTRGLAEAAERLKKGDREAGRAVAENAMGYAALLRQHILKEDQILFPMAGQVIPQGRHGEVLRKFHEAGHGSGDHDHAKHAHYVELGESLVTQAGS
ncbi:MAG: hemerythrin domain-containing protein [Gemmatimonadota bacterium]